MLPRPLIAALLAVLGTSCRDDAIKHLPDPAPAPRCGDGVADEDEECDGSDLKDATCASLGFESGSMACDARCKLVTLACVKRCGNNTLDLGEECDGALGSFECSTWGYKACSDSCSIDSRACITHPFVPAPALSLSHGGPAVMTDLAPRGLGDLVVAVPSFGRLETFPYTNEQGLVAGRKLSYGHTPAWPMAADLDGDGEQDLVSIQLDGTTSRHRYLSGENRFLDEPFPASDGGAACTTISWVGRGRINDDEQDDLVALGCPTAPQRAGALQVFYGGIPPNAPIDLPYPDLIAASVADVDGDGRLELLFVSDGQLALRRLQSALSSFTFTELSPVPLPYLPSAMAPCDLDGDGDLDLVVTVGDSVRVLENTGPAFAETSSLSATSPRGLLCQDLDLDHRPDFAWVAGAKLFIRRNAGGMQFLPYEATTGTGTFVSLATGDLDADGDPDFAVTYSQAGDATLTHVLVNKTR